MRLKHHMESSDGRSDEKVAAKLTDHQRRPENIGVKDLLEVLPTVHQTRIRKRGPGFVDVGVARGECETGVVHEDLHCKTITKKE